MCIQAFHFPSERIRPQPAPSRAPQHYRWQLLPSGVSNAVTGTRGMQPKLQRPRRTPIAPTHRSCDLRNPAGTGNRCLLVAAPIPLTAGQLAAHHTVRGCVVGELLPLVRVSFAPGSDILDRPSAMYFGGLAHTPRWAPQGSRPQLVISCQR